MSSKVIPFIMVAVGAIFCTVGILFITSQRAFEARSDVAQLLVTAVERKDTEEGTLFRPTFEATSDGDETLDFTGGTWVSPKPHNKGDVVDGRVDWAQGEIRSDAMMTTSKRLGIIFVALGGILMVVSLLVSGMTMRRSS